jgi:glycosyltransferase involved in cell wall biosynthesis
MQSNPRVAMPVSVLMSVYRKENPLYLRDSLESLSKQDLPAEEVVIVEDGPIGEELHQIIENYRPLLKIRSIIIDKNIGLGGALSMGLRECKNELVARFDTDDLANPERLSLQLNFMKSHPHVDILGSWATDIDSSGNETRLRKAPLGHDNIVKNLWASPMIHPSVMFRRSKIIAAGNYSHQHPRHEDYELWFRCARMGLIFDNLPLTLIKYRFSKENLFRQSRKMVLARCRTGKEGSRSVRLPIWKQFACYVPFVRSLLPRPLQMFAYTALRWFDPRQH